jgi:hypothetical protein
MGCQSSKSSAEREPTDEPPIVKADIPSTSAKMEARIASKSLESTKNTPQEADQATNQDDITLSAEAEGKVSDRFNFTPHSAADQVPQKSPRKHFCGEIQN